MNRCTHVILSSRVECETATAWPSKSITIAEDPVRAAVLGWEVGFVEAFSRSPFSLSVLMHLLNYESRSLPHEVSPWSKAGESQLLFSCSRMSVCEDLGIWLTYPRMSF